MDVESFKHRVPAHLWNEFRAFLNTGEASEEFLDLLDSDPDMQVLAEEAFESEAARFEQFAAGLQQLESVPAQGGPTAEILSSELARTVRQAATLPADERQRVAEQTAAVLRRSASPQQQQQVSSMVSHLNQVLEP
jgi:hypothetical protein